MTTCVRPPGSTLSWAESAVIGFDCASLRERPFGIGRVAGERGRFALLDGCGSEASGGTKNAKWGGSVFKRFKSGGTVFDETAYE